MAEDKQAPEPPKKSDKQLKEDRDRFADTMKTIGIDVHFDDEKKRDGDD